jgi:hypothetical protein
MKNYVPILLIFLIVAFAGCSHEPSPTQVTSVTDKVGPPTEAGIIMRGESPVGLTWVDTDFGLRVVIGADMDEFCAGIVDFDLVSYQDANLPDGRIVSNMVGAMQTRVWDFLEFDCDLFTSIPPIAVVTAMLKGVDNDLEGTVVHNTNTWGWMAQGSLLGADGSRVRFSGFVRQQFGNDSGAKAISKINLH